jgi:Protein of unknown function (DUF3375)
MNPNDLQVQFETSPAIRLLQARNAPWVVGFLYERFKKSHAITIPHSELLSALKLYQERLLEEGIDGLRDKPDEYLRDWTSPDKRWLHRFLESGRDEPMYQLTSHSETVIEFLQRAVQQDLTFVGTESRLRVVMQALEQLLVGASDDRELRLQHLREQQDRIAHEIEEIERHGRIETFAPTRIREQFSLAVRMLRELQGDFRAVEEKFKVITRQVQQGQVKGLDSRGGILADALGAEDELKQQDQGISFFEFVKFIQSPQQQDKLQTVIRQLLKLEVLADQSAGLETIRYMVKQLLDEAEQVLRTTRRLSASLRRLLDRRTSDERQRVAELLRQIRVLVTAMSDQPPRQIGIDVDDALEMAAPLSRTNWSPQSQFEQVDLAEQIVDEALRRELFRKFQQMRPIPWNAMRQRIRLAIERHGQCTLGQLLEDERAQGLMDVIGYVQIACDDGHLICGDAEEAITLTDCHRGQRAVKIPLITFVAGAGR